MKNAIILLTAIICVVLFGYFYSMKQQQISEIAQVPAAQPTNGLVQAAPVIPATPGVPMDGGVAPVAVAPTVAAPMPTAENPTPGMAPPPAAVALGAGEVDGVPAGAPQPADAAAPAPAMAAPAPSPTPAPAMAAPAPAPAPAAQAPAQR